MSSNSRILVPMLPIDEEDDAAEHSLVGFEEKRDRRGGERKILFAISMRGSSCCFVFLFLRS